MADQSSSGPIPEGWRLEKKEGSKVSSYFCPKTGQRFFTHEDMMRYVNYAKKAGLPIYMPNFDRRKRNPKAGQSSGSADHQIAENLESEKHMDKDRSLDTNKATDVQDSEPMNIDFEENMKSEDVPSENYSALGADIMMVDEPFHLQQTSNVRHVDPLIVEQTFNVPPVVRSPLSKEESLPAADPAAMIQEFSAENPKPKIRHFRRRGR